jgi:mucin-19
MAREWLQRAGSKNGNNASSRARALEKRRRSRLPDLLVQVLEERTLLAVTASVSASVLDVNLSAAGDSATLTFDGTSVDVSGTGYGGGSFLPASFSSGLSVTGSGLSNQSVNFNNLGSVATPISLGAMVSVSDVTALSVSSSGFTSTGDVSFQIADGETGTSNLLGTTGQATASITITSVKIHAHNITIDADGTMTVSTTGNGALGANLANVNVGSAATIAIDPTSPATGSQLSGTGDVTIAATSTATITADPSANAPGATGVDAAVANSSLTTSAIAHISGSASVTAGGDLALTASNTTNATADADGTAQAGAGGGTVAVSVLNSTTKAFIDGSATASGDTVTISSTSNTTATTTAKSTDQGATANDSSTQTDLTTYNAKTSDGPVGIAGALAVTDLTRDTEAYIASNGQITGTTAIHIGSSATTNDSTVADGSATTGTVGVGVAVAIDIAKATNEASIQSNAKLSAPSITVQSLTPGSNAYGAQATAGAGGQNVGVAGSLALNLVSNTSAAAITAGNTLTVAGGDDVTFIAQNNVTETASALPTSGGGGGGKVGVGASAALNIATNTAQADLESSAQLTGARDLTLSASSDDTMTTTATAGASGGIAVSPSVGISIANNTTDAEVEAGSMLSLTRALSATAMHSGSTTTTSGGTATGTGAAAVGASIAITVATDQTTATTARNINAGGDVSFISTASGTSSAIGMASAAGGKQDDGSGDDKDSSGNDVDSQNSAQRSFADSEGDSAGAGDSSADGATPSASTSDGKVSVAAAVTVNIADSEADAIIPDGFSVTSGGLLTVSAANTTSATSTASGTATGTAKVGVGAAVALNLAKARSEGEIGAGTTISAQAITVQAQMNGGSNAFGASATSGAGASKVGVAGSVGINLASAMSQATIGQSTASPAASPGATVTITTGGTGAVALTAEDDSDSTVSAMPATDDGATGSSVGIGAALGLDLVNNTALAALANTVSMTGAGALSLSAASDDTMTTTAETGAKSTGGVAVSAAVALSIANDTTTAQLGSSDNTHTLGSFSATATHTGSTTSTAGGAAVGSSAAIGASVAVTIANDLTTATTASNIVATGDVSFMATGAGTSAANGMASAAGGQSDDGSGDGKDSSGNNVDSNNDAQRSFANTEGDSESSDGVGDSSSSASTPSASTSDGKVSVAAAVTVNIADSEADAIIPDGFSVTSGGLLTVSAANTTSATSTASGTATGTAKVGVGAAVALNLAKARSEGEIGAGTTISAQAITVQAQMNGGSNAFGASATSGAGASKVGVAGSVGINLASAVSQATIGQSTASPAASPGATVTITSGGTGAVALTAEDDSDSTVSAMPATDDGATGSSVGVGAALGLNLVNNTALAALANNVSMTGAGALSLSATSDDTMTTTAETGAKSTGGVAVSAAVALSIANNTTTAQLGSSDNTHTLGSFSATATHTGSTTSTSGGTAAGSSAAIGASISVNLATDQTTATTASNITATGAVSFMAIALGASEANATASASGGKDDDGSGDNKDTSGNDVDSNNASQRNFANTEGDSENSDGVGDSSGDSATPSASTSDGKVSVAAAVTVNIADSESDATIPAGLTVNSTGGALTVSATNTTTAASTASGDASGTAQVGVGAAVALNLVTAKTEATIQATGAQATTIQTMGVDVNAGMTGPGTPMNSFTVSATSGAGGTKVGVAGSVAINIVTDTNQALIETGTSVTAGGGDVSLTSVNNSADTASALPATDSGATGNKVGVGASLGLNIISDTTDSEIQDGASLTGAGAVTVTASSPHTITTTAKNGAAGSVAVGAGIAIVIAKDETKARIGSDANTLDAAGAVMIGASGSFMVVSEADATAADNGGSVGVGATVVVNVAQDSFLADLDRNLTALGAVSITGAGTGTGQASATASENGAPSTGSDMGGSNGTADQETSNQSSFAKTEGGSDAPNVSAPPTSNSEMTSPSSEASNESGGSSGESKVGVAAAVAVNVVTTSTVASIEDGLTVTSGGLLTVGTTNQTSANALANGQAVANQNSIGAAVSLNVANVTNDATIGSSDIISAHGANVTALMTSGQVNDFTSQGLGVAIGTQVGVAGSVGINVITVNTQASIGAGTHVKSFGALAVETSSDETLQNIAFTLAVGEDAGVGAAVAVNVVNDTTLSFLDSTARADVADGTQVTAESSFNPSADSISPTFNIPGISGLHPTAFAAGAGAASGGAGIAGSFIVNVINDTTHASINSGALVNTLTGTAGFPTANADQGVTVSATDAIAITDWVGAIGGGEDVGVGAALDVNIVTEDTQAYISSNATVDASQNVAVKSGTTGDFSSITAAAGIGESAGIAGTASIEILSLTTNAFIDHDTTVVAKGNVLVQATHRSTINTLAGQLSIGGDASVGAAVSTVVDTENTDAFIGTNDNITAKGTGGAIQVLTGNSPTDTTPFTGVAVTATSFQNLQTIAVGGSASGAAAIAGSIAVNVLKYTTLASIDQGATITATNAAPGSGPGVMVTAADPLTLLSAAGAFAGGADAGLGAGVDIDSITKNTQAFIATAGATADGNVLVQAKSSENLTSVTGAVGISGTVAIAGSAGVYVLAITTRAFIGNDPLNPTAGSTSVQASGSILVAASEQTVLNILTGNFSGSGTASVGAAAGVPVITKTTEAFIGAGANVGALGLGSAIDAENGRFDISYAPYGSAVGVAQPKPENSNLGSSGGNSLTSPSSPRLGEERIATPESQSVNGLAVTAVNADALQGVGVDGGVSGTVAVNLSGSVAVLTNQTDAYIGAGAAVNSNNMGAATTQAVMVAAGNDASFLGIAAALSISGTVSVTPGVVVLVINNTTTAAIDDGAAVNTEGDVSVQAHASGDVLSIAATGAISGTASVGGSVSYVGVNDTTKAMIGDTATTDTGGTHVSADGNVLVDATDDTVAYLITGSLSVGVGGAGVGGAVGIAILDKTTDAYIGSHATVNALGKTAGLTGIFDGNLSGSSFETASSFNGVAVQAATSENVTNIAAAGAAGFYAGLAGGVSVEIFNSNTQAYVGNNAHINASSTGANPAQAVNVSAVNQATNFSFAGGLGGGIAGIAGGVDVGLLKNSTQAYISNGADVHAKQDVDVYALSNDNVQTYALGAGVGVAALAASVSVWSIGVPYSAGYTDGNASDGTVNSLPSGQLSGSSTNSEGQTGGASSLIGSMTSPSNNGAAGNTQFITGNVSSAQGGVSGSITGDPVADAVSSTAVPQGTVAFIGSGVSVNAGGNVDVAARSEVSYTGIAGGLAAGGVGIGAAIEIANIQGSTQAYIDTGSTVTAGGNVSVDADLVSDTSSGTAFAGTGGAVGIGAQVMDIQDSSTEKATLNSGVMVPQAQQIQITAESNRSLTAHALGGNFGGVVVGVGVAIANATGGPTAGIASNAQIGQTGTVAGTTVTATSTDSVTAKSAGVGAGAIGLTGTYADAESTPTVAASIGGNAEVTGAISVGATATGDATGNALGITIASTASLGASFAVAVVSPNVSAEVSPSADLIAGTSISVTALNNITAGASPLPDGADTMAVTGSGALFLGASGSVANSTASPVVDAGAAAGATLSAGTNVSIVSLSHGHAQAKAIGAGLGIVGVGISIATATDGGSSDAHSDSNVNLSGGNNVTLSSNEIDDATADSTAASGGIVAGDGADATATINPGISATTGNGGQLNAVNTLSVTASLTPQATADVTGISAGALAVGASVASATDSPTVTATAGGAGTTITGGSLLVSATTSVPAGNDSASSTASGSAGALVAATATTSTASNSGTVSSSLANRTTLYLSNGITVEANGNTHQFALGTSDFGGIVAVGANNSTAESTAQTSATVGTGVNISAGDPIVNLVDGTIYYIVPDPSNSNLISLAASFQNALKSSGGAHPQPGSAAVTIALGQPAFSAGNHSLTPVNLIGSTPTRFNPATALSQSGGTSFINVGSNSFYLGEPVIYHKSSGPALAITANGDDINFAQAVSGSGGVVAGSAAAANTNTGGGASASIADNSGNTTMLDVASLYISALHTAEFDSQTNTIQADAVGFSGSLDTNNDSSTVNAHIGNHAQIVTQSIQVLATNTTLKDLVPSGQNNVSAGSGGVLQGNAAESDTYITNNTTADIGSSANIDVTGSTASPGLFLVYALNNVNGSDTVNLDTGGLIDGSDATSIIHADTNNATAQIGSNTTIYTVGDINLDTRTTSNVTVAPTVHTYGLASPGSIDGEATIAETDAVKVNPGAFIQAQGDLNLIAGGDMNGDLNDLTMGSNAYELNASAVPAFELTSLCQIDQTNTISIASGAVLESAADANLKAEQHGNAVTNAFGTGKDWLTAVSGALGSLFGGTGLSADAHTGTGKVNTTTTVTVNGTIELGINNNQSLSIAQDILANPTDFTVSGAISFTQDTEDLTTDLVNELKTLEALVIAYAGDTAAVTAYNSDIQQIQFQLTQLGLSQKQSDGTTVYAGSINAVPFIRLAPISAKAGTIFVNGDNFVGSGHLVAPGDVSITITNNSPAFLSVGEISIPQSFGGTVFYDGSTVTTNAGIGAINLNMTAPSFNIQAANTSSPPAITITNTYNAADPANSGFEGGNFLSPDIDLDGNISAPPTVLTVDCPYGSVVTNANIDVGTVKITAGQNFIQSYVPGIDNIAGDPATLWASVTALTEANAAATPPTPPFGTPYNVNGDPNGNAAQKAIAAALANPGTGNIMVGNDVFISAQYLNIDGTIQSGDPNQKVTIDSTVKTLYNVNIPNQTFTESMTQAISAAVTAYTDFKNGNKAAALAEYSAFGVWTQTTGPAAFQEFLLPEAVGDNIEVYYEATTGQLALGQTAVQGGLIVLFGDVLNTGIGNLNILDGYGAINVVNNTSYPLVTSGLSTGGGTAGELKITDTGKENNLGQPLVTEYFRQNGQVYSNSYYSNPDGTVASVVSAPAQYSGPNAGARTASYQPATARFVWEDGQDLSVTITDNYQTSSWVSVIDLGSSDLVSSSTTAGTPAPLPAGEWIDNATTDPSLASVAPGTGVDANDYEYSLDVINTGTPTSTVTSSSNSTWYGTTTYYQTTITTTPKKNININSIRADRPINITFTGYDEGAPQQKLSVSTQGDLYVNGQIENAAGPTTLSAPKGSIIQENAGAPIGGEDITLSAANGIGGTNPVVLNMTNGATPSSPNPGTLNATTSSGPINLDDLSGSMRIGHVTTAGDVTLTADESIFAASASSLVEGGAIDLVASFGSIGTLGTGGTANSPAVDALPVVVDVGTGTLDKLNVTALDDVYVKQSSGDLRLDKIVSTTGNVRIEVPGGSLVDANNVSVPDTQNLAALEARWNSMLATQSTAQISITSTINAFESQIDQEYQTYWIFRNEQPDPSVFDPSFEVTLPPGQLDAWTTYYTNQGTGMGLSGAALTTFVDNAITTLENANTQEYRTINAIFGKLGSAYNPNYRYYANQTPLSGNVNLTFGAANIDATGFLINLPGNGYVTGQVVAYHANGGSVSGLTDGAMYYVIVDPVDSNQISLAASYANATASVPVPIHLSAVTGTGNALSNVFASPNMAFGPAAIDNTGFLISLPGNAYTTGQAVVYHANGGSVSNLTDGGTYYVIADPSDPTQISLAASYADATAVNPVPIQLAPVTGSGNTLSEIFQTFGAANVDPTGFSIDLPQNVFTTGEAVIYHANGGSVTGLTDGNTYYVIVDPNNTGNTAFIGLASSALNATSSPPIPIHLANITGTGNYLSEVDVESQRAAWSQSQLQNSIDLSIVEPVLFPSTVQAIPDPNIEGNNVAIVVSSSIGTVAGQDTIMLPLSAALPQQEALDLAAAQPADVTFYNAGQGNTLVAVSPTDPGFDPVQLTVNLQKGISLENTGVVDATAGQNLNLDSGQDVANHGPLLPIKLDVLTAMGGVSVGHPEGVVRVLGLDGIVNAQPAFGINIVGGNLFLEGGNTGGIGTSALPIVIDLASDALLEEANAQLSVYISEVNGNLNLVTAFSATGDVDLTADGSIANGNLFNDVNVEAVNAVLTAGEDGDHTNTIGTSAAPIDLVLSGSVVAQAYLDIHLDEVSGDLKVDEVHSLAGDAFLTSDLGSILDDHTPTVSDPIDDVIATNITLSAALLGFIGSALDALEIDVAETGTLTSSSGQNAFITQPIGDLNIYTVSCFDGGTAFIIASDGNIYNGIPSSQMLENVQSGKSYLFASENIGTSTNPITTAVGNVQGQSTTGSTFLVNSGALTVGGVLADTMPPGIQSGGTVTITAMSPITITQNINAVSDITLTSTHDASSGNMEEVPGVTVDSTAGSVFLQVGDDFTQDAGSSIQAAVGIVITGDFNNLAGPGSQITINGLISAHAITINANGANAVVTLNNPAGINTTPPEPTGVLTVNGGTVKNTLLLNDSAEQRSLTGVMTFDTIMGLGMGGLGIIYNTIQVLTINLGTGNDVFSVQSTNATTDTTVINTGTQADQIDIGSRSPLIGGIVDEILGPLTITGGGIDTTSVDDTGSTIDKSGTLTSSTLTGLNMGPEGITYTGLATVNVSLGSGTNTFLVATTHTGQTTVNTGTGTNTVNVQTISGPTSINGLGTLDTINVSSTAPTPGGVVNQIDAVLSVSGGSGVNTVNVDDTGSTVAKAGTLTANALTGLEMLGLLSYSNLTNLNIALGSGGNTFKVIDTSAVTSTAIKTGTGKDNLTVLATAGPLDVDTQAGPNNVFLGSAALNNGGVLQNLQAPVVLTGSGTDTLSVDDSADAQPRTGTLSATAISGLGMGPSGVTYSGFSTVNLSLGKGGYNFTIAGTIAGTTTINSGTGTNIFNVQSIAGPTSIVSTFSPSTINVGSLAPAHGGTLAGIAALLTIQGGQYFDVVNADDSGDAANASALLTTTGLTGLGMGVAGGIALSQVSALSVGLGSGTNTVLVTGTTTGQTVVNGGDGNTTLNIRAIQGPSTFNLGSGNNTINVGSMAPASGGTLAPIAAALSINGGTGTNALDLDDTGDAAARTGSLGTTSVTGLGMQKGITETGISALNLALGSGSENLTVAGTGPAGAAISTVGGNDVFNIQAAAGPVAITTGPGNGTFNVGSQMPARGGTDSGVAGLLTLDPGTGTNTLDVDDSGDSTVRTATLSATSLTGMGLGAGIDYQNMAALSVRMGQGSDIFSLTGLAPVTTAATIDGWSGYNTFSAVISGDFTANLTLLNFAEITSFTIGGDLSGQVIVHSITQGSPPASQPNGQIDSMTISGSVTSSGVIQAPAIESLKIGGDLGGTVSESSASIPGSLTVTGSITSTGNVFYVGTLTNLTVGQDVAGQIQDFTTIQNISIGDSLTSTGTITAGNINDLAIEQILAGNVKVTGNLDNLTVGSAVTGTYSAGHLGTVTVDGVVVNNPNPPPPPPPAPPPPSPPPPLVTVTGVHEVFNKKHQVKQITVSFSGPVNATEAAETVVYRLATAGKKGSFTAKNAGIIRLASAAYASAGNTVTLTPKKPFALTKTVQLVVSGTGATGLLDASGRLIDGDHNGQAGGNAIAYLSKRGVTVNAVELARAAAPAAKAGSGHGPSEGATSVTTATIGGPLPLFQSPGRKAKPSDPPRL